MMYNLLCICLYYEHIKAKYSKWGRNTSMQFLGVKFQIMLPEKYNGKEAVMTSSTYVVVITFEWPSISAHNQSLHLTSQAIK